MESVQNKNINLTLNILQMVKSTGLDKIILSVNVGKVEKTGESP